MASKTGANGSLPVPLLIASVFLLAAIYVTILVSHSATSTPSAPARINGTNYSSYQDEIARAEQRGYTINSTALSCTSDSQCVKVLIAACNNNVPSQFICINSAYQQEFDNQSQEIANSGGQTACPEYILEGTISCGCVSNYCTEEYTR